MPKPEECFGGVELDRGDTILRRKVLQALEGLKLTDPNSLPC